MKTQIERLADVGITVLNTNPQKMRCKSGKDLGVHSYHKAEYLIIRCEKNVKQKN